MGMDYQKLYREPINERDLSAAFHMGLRTAVHLIEEAETLSIEGRKYLVECLKILIANGKAEAPDL